MLNKHYIY